jgi:hypothetical protein
MNRIDLIFTILICLGAGAEGGYLLGNILPLFPPPQKIETPNFMGFIVCRNEVRFDPSGNYTAGNCTATYQIYGLGGNPLTPKIPVVPNTYTFVNRPSELVGHYWTVIIEAEMTPAEGIPLKPGDSMYIGELVENSTQRLMPTVAVEYPSTKLFIECTLGPMLIP